MSSGNRRKLVVYSALFFLCLCFIWGNSAMPGDVSGEISRGLLKKLLSVFGRFGTNAEFILRKCAHFSEFCLMAMVFMRILSLLKIGKLHWLCPCLLTGMSVALVDETIQLFSPGRNSQVRDIWVDVAGVAVGILLSKCIEYLVMGIKARKSGKT